MTSVPVLSVSLALLVAQAGEVPDLAQWGLAGVVLVALGRFAQTTVKRLTDELERSQAYARELNASIQKDIIPAAIRLSEVAERMLRHLEDIERRR